MKSQLYNELGKTIKAIRMAQGIKQQVLADQLGLSRVSIVNIEKGRHKPQIHVLYDLSVVLKCTFFDLLPDKSLFLQLPKELTSKLTPLEEVPVFVLLEKATQGE